MLGAEHLAGAGYAGLHLVGYEQHIVLVAQVEAGLQIAVVGNKHTGFALDGLGYEGAYLFTILVKGFLKGLGVVIGDADETGGERTVLVVRTGVVAHRNHGHRAAVEVTLAAYHLDLVVLYAFLHGTPAAGQLQSGLHAFSTGVHRQNAVIAEVVVHKLLILAQRVVVEGARGEAEHVGLVFQGLYNAGVAVALVHGRIGGEEVEIFLSLHVPHVDAFTLVQHHGQGVIVVGAVLFFQLHQLFAGAQFLMVEGCSLVG